VKDSFCEKAEHVFHEFPKHHMSIWLRDFNTKIGREDIFKYTYKDVTVSCHVEVTYKFCNAYIYRQQMPSLLRGYRVLIHYQLYVKQLVPTSQRWLEQLAWTLG
jgi:hypothetical protein